MSKVIDIHQLRDFKV